MTTKSNWLTASRRISKTFHPSHFPDLWCDITLGASRTKPGNSTHFREGLRASVLRSISTRSLFISSSPCREAEETLPMLSVFHLFIYKSKTGAWIRWGVRAIWRESRDDGASCLGMKITFSGLTLPRVCVQDRALKCLFYTWIFFRSLTRVLGLS